MKFPLVRDLAAEGFPVRLTCGVLGFSAQAFYKWQAQPVCRRDFDDAHLVNAIRDVHEDDPEFGYRFISDELERAGHNVGERRVWRLCSEHRIWSTTTKKGRKSSGKRPGPAVHDDLVQRNFTAPAPDRVWLTDITEHRTDQGKLYACVHQRRLLEPDRRSRHLGSDDRGTGHHRAALGCRQASAEGHRGRPLATGAANFVHEPSGPC